MGAVRRRGVIFHRPPVYKRGGLLQDINPQDDTQICLEQDSMQLCHINDKREVRGELIVG